MAKTNTAFHRTAMKHTYHVFGLYVEEEGGEHAHGLLASNVATLHQPGQPRVELRLHAEGVEEPRSGGLDGGREGGKEGCMGVFIKLQFRFS